MSRRVFLDSSGWLATISEREASHAEALNAYRSVLSSGRGFVTTNLVVAEMYVLLSRQRGSVAAIQFLDVLERDPAHEVRYVSRDLERQAIDRWLRPYADHRFSLTDAVSFEIMRVERIGEAFALDRHFQIAGFDVLP